MPLRRIVPLRDALSCTFFKRAASPDVRLSRLSLRLSLPSYRHPERSRGIFALATFMIPVLIRLHETPYPTFLEYQASRFRSHAYTLSP